MKKVLSLVLVAVLAIGMGSAAFAWNNTIWGNIVDLENIKGYADSYSLIDGYPGNGYDDSFPHEVNTNQGIVYGGKKSGVIKMGKVYATDEPGLNIDLWNTMFQGNIAAGTATTTYNYYAPDLDKMYARGLFKSTTIRPVDITTWSAYDANVVDGWTIAKIYDAIKPKLGSSWTQEQVARAIGDYFYTNGMMKVVSGTTYSGSDAMYFRTKYDDVTMTWGTSFVLDSSSTTNGRRRLTITEIQKSSIKLNVQISGNSGPIKKCELIPSKGLIEFRTQSEWVSTKSSDFEVVMFLTIDGKRFDDETVTITGTLDNKRIKVYANMDFVDISEGYIAEPVEFNTKIAVDIGNGVTIHTKMFKDKLYYGVTSREPDEEATIVFKQYKNVSNVVTLKTVGFANVNDYVTFSTDYAGYYVYDADMNYLGKADEQVEFSTRYYLADQKLDLEEEEEEEDDDDDTEEPTQGSNPGTGGDNTSPNINANPGTGC